MPVPPDISLRGHCQTCQVEVAKNRFYCDEHRPPPSHKRKKDGDAPKKPATAVSAAREIAQAGTTDAARKRPPSAAEWRTKMSLALALLTTWMVLRVIGRSDVSEAPDETQEAWANRLDMGDDEVDAIVDPFVALITGPLGAANKRYGRGAIEILGVLPACLALTTWRTRIRQFEREHCPPRERRFARAPRPQRADGAPPADLGAPGTAVQPAYLNGAIGAQEQEGLVPPTA